MTLLLQTNGVYKVVDGTDTRAAASNANDWDKLDLMARTIIATTLDDNQIPSIQDCLTSNAMWKKLEDMHSDRSELTKQMTYTRYYNYKIGHNQSLAEAYLEIEQIVASLHDMGETISEQSVVSKIVSSLPDRYKALRVSWDSVEPKSQTMAALLVRLKKEDMERQQEEHKSNANKSKAFNTNQRPPNNGKRQTIEERKKNSSCHNCGKMGHWAMSAAAKATTATIASKIMDAVTIAMTKAIAAISKAAKRKRARSVSWPARTKSATTSATFGTTTTARRATFADAEIGFRRCAHWTTRLPSPRTDRPKHAELATCRCRRLSMVNGRIASSKTWSTFRNSKIFSRKRQCSARDTTSLAKAR